MSSAAADPLSDLLTVDDFEEAARARLPKPTYDYYRSGADAEITLRDNRVRHFEQSTQPVALAAQLGLQLRHFERDRHLPRGEPEQFEARLRVCVRLPAPKVDHAEPVPRLGPADALYCGFATHYVPRERVAEMRASWDKAVARAKAGA